MITKATGYRKQVFIYIVLAAIISVFLILSLCYGGYPFEFSVVLLIVAARLVDGIIAVLSLPAGAFAPFSEVYPPITGAIQGGFLNIATLVQPIHQSWPDWMSIMVWEVRFPRVLMVILVGAGLAVAGMTFQGTFRNSLVSENILGVAAGAGFGAAIGILIGNNTLLIQLLAFTFGLLTLFINFGIARVYRSNSTILIVLAGIVVGSAFSAGTSLIKYLADPLSNQLSTIVFWLMGSFSRVNYEVLFSAGPVIVIGIAVLAAVRWRLNVMSMGDEEARALGVDVGRFRGLVLICATLITAVAVSVCGTISWVGLVIPHIGRMLVGPDHRALLPLTIVLGVAYMLIVDTLCLSLTTGVIPTNILTSIIGVPVFVYLLKKTKDSWA